MIPERQRGWVAAVLDLKGHIIRKKNHTRATPQIVMMVESKDFAVVRVLADLTGSRLEPQKPKAPKDWMRRACTAHCPDAHVHMDDNWQMPPIARWAITGVGAAIILYNVLPFMATDRGWQEAMDEAIENAVFTGQGSGAIKATTRRLLGLGWDLPPAILDKLIPAEYEGDVESLLRPMSEMTEVAEAS